MTAPPWLLFGVAVALLAAGVLVGDRIGRRRSAGAAPQRRVGPHYGAALAHVACGEPAAAIRQLGVALREETDAAEAHLLFGDLLRETGQTERAIEVHKSLLHRPDLAAWQRTAGLYSLALDFKQAGLVDRAERTIREVLERDPAHVGALRAWRRVLEESGRWERAIELQRRIARIDPEAPDLVAWMRVEWARQLLARDPQAAEQQLRAALHERPDEPAARVLLGRCLLSQGRAAEAVALLESAAAGPGVWAPAAIALLEQASEALEDWSVAERVCAAVCARDPAAWRAQLVRGRAALERGDPAAAEGALRAALAARPTSPRVQRLVWRLLRERDEGVETFEAWLAQADGDRFVDGFLCLRCRFRSAELFARCPHCHEWGSMTEERPV